MKAAAAPLCGALALLIGSGLAAFDATADDQKADITRILQERVRLCWMIPPEAHNEPPFSLQVSLREDGTLEAVPSVVEPAGGEAANSALAASAIRAVTRCAPYSSLKEAAPYPAWKSLIITFDPTP